MAAKRNKFVGTARLKSGGVKVVGNSAAARRHAALRPGVNQPRLADCPSVSCCLLNNLCLRAGEGWRSDQWDNGFTVVGLISGVVEYVL